MSGSALTDHQTNRIKARRLLVNFVQLAKEEEERMERRICVNLACCKIKKMKDRQREIDEKKSKTSKTGVAETEVES